MCHVRNKLKYKQLTSLINSLLMFHTKIFFMIHDETQSCVIAALPLFLPPNIYGSKDKKNQRGLQAYSIIQCI